MWRCSTRRTTCPALPSPFTVPDLFKAALKQNSSDGPLCFLLLEKEDRPAQNSTKPFVRLNAENNVYMASGA
jgi:hypothetical protein